jgi:hypothetical protein
MSERLFRVYTILQLEESLPAHTSNQKASAVALELLTEASWPRFTSADEVSVENRVEVLRHLLCP